VIILRIIKGTHNCVFNIAALLSVTEPHTACNLSHFYRKERPGFDHVPFHVRFVEKIGTLWQVFLKVFRFSHFGIIPQMLSNHLHLNILLLLSAGQTLRVSESSDKAIFRVSGSNGQNTLTFSPVCVFCVRSAVLGKELYILYNWEGKSFIVL